MYLVGDAALLVAAVFVADPFAAAPAVVGAFAGQDVGSYDADGLAVQACVAAAVDKARPSAEPVVVDIAVAPFAVEQVELALVGPE